MQFAEVASDLDVNEEAKELGWGGERSYKRAYSH